jgi:hypothetical protein
MVPSSALAVTTDGEHLTCSDFSVGEIVRLVIIEFITEYFGGLSLSPRRSNSGATFMGSTYHGSPSLWRAMIKDTTEEFHIASSVEGGSGLLSPRRRGTGALPAPVTTTP